MSSSLQSHGLRPTRLLCSWDSPGKEYWSGLSFPPPGDLPDPGIKPRSLPSLGFIGRFFTTSATWEALPLLAAAAAAAAAAK